MHDVEHLLQENERLQVLCDRYARESAAVAIEMSAMQKQNELMTEALHTIDVWSRSYPLSAFPEPDFVKANEALKEAGITLDAIAAHNMRHVLNEVGKIARDALEGK